MPALTALTPILFLSPDASFFAELHTGKKPQLKNVVKIDFPLIEDGVVQKTHLRDALQELAPKQLHIILSDELFLHHIADFPVKSKETLEEQIANKVGEVFPDQNESMHIVTLDLAKTNKIQTIQISAVTKKNLQNIAEATAEADVSVKMLIPASFVVKAFVSVDPSLFILQTPSALLVTSHYIGVESAERIEGNDLKSLTKSVKKLKDDHSYIQHAYVTAPKADSQKIADALEEIMPTQAVTIPSVEAEEDTPDFFKIIIIGYKDVIENKFPFPEFHLPEVEVSAISEDEEEVDPIEVEDEPVVTASVTTATVTTATVASSEKAELADVFEDEAEDIEEEKVVATKEVKVSAPEPQLEEEEVKVEEKPKAPVKTVEIKDVQSTQRLSSKKQSKGLFSYILLTVGVALVISLIGGGIVISQQALQNSSGEQVSPTDEITPTPMAEAEPTATPTPEVTPIPKDEINILVVNATSIAGYAGETSDTLEEAGYENVTAANAKGEYEDGTFIMVKDEEQTQLIAQIVSDSDLELETLEYSDVEDTQERYDVIIVLNE